LEIFELILALLSANPSGINGRTALQKLCYFASVMLHMDLEYGPDFYGPFSPAVATNIQSLVETDFVLERKLRTFRYRTMYCYSLAEDGIAIAERIREDYQNEYRTIRTLVRKYQQITHCNYQVLSWAAKVHYVLTQNKKAMTYAEAIKASELFGWKLTNTEVESAVGLLRALKLIKRTQPKRRPKPEMA
jgi:uncharacterized protein YwgA